MSEQIDALRAMANYSRAMVVVAHPDDIEWGMAGTVARLTAAGKSVVYVLATRGEAGSEDPNLTTEQVGDLRQSEEIAAAREVGVETVEFLGFPDSQVYYGPDLRKSIARCMRRHKPEIVFTSNYAAHWPGGGLNHPDHRHVGEAAVDAITDASLRSAFPDLVAEGLNAWRGCKLLLISGTEAPNAWVDISPVIDKAVASLAAHKSYLAELQLDAGEVARGRSSQLGQEHGVDYAESFSVHSL
ncbi:MAG: PIG-L family deacetylase [Chloroflexi bacterium]|nr:PIG-L family deacetylase [Chloroflexota bacterium]